MGEHWLFQRFRTLLDKKRWWFTEALAEEPGHCFLWVLTVFESRAFKQSIYLDPYSSETLNIKPEASPRVLQTGTSVIPTKIALDGSHCNVLPLNMVPQNKSILPLPPSGQPQLLLCALAYV